jgi:hypothetical protein
VNERKERERVDEAGVGWVVVDEARWRWAGERGWRVSVRFGGRIGVNPSESNRIKLPLVGFVAANGRKTA